MRQVWAEINLDNIRKNIRGLKNLLDPSVIMMGAVKGNAYGFGVLPVARIFQEEGARAFAVATVDEGIELRKAGYTEMILILGHVFPEEYDEILSHDLSVQISTEEEARAMSALAESRNRKMKAHIKIDTGMSRLGFMLDGSIAETLKRVVRQPGLKIEGIFTHLATEGDGFCDLQFYRFQKLLQDPALQGIDFGLRHICNSAAIFHSPEMHLDMVRAGYAAYGLFSNQEMPEGTDFTLTPAIAIKARLGHIKTVDAGTSIGYDQTFVTQRKSILGDVPMGYVDGLFRCMSNKGEVLIHGQRCPIIGIICMDHFMVDLTDVDSPQIGDEVVLTGRQGTEEICLEEFASFGNTYELEAVCRLGRLPRRYVGGEFR